MRVIHHPHAEAELIEAARYYEARVPALGAQFLDAVSSAVADIVAAPARWRPIEADVRRYLMRRFPFAIYYRILPDHLRILAIKHHSRHPGYWRGRLND